MNFNRNLSFTLMVLVSALLITINYYTILTTSAVRAYINGESKYSKGQKDASRHLITFLANGDRSYYNNAIGELKIPLGDREARLALQGGKDDERVIEGFSQGKNHPDDIASMIWLFRNFKAVSFMSRAIDIWRSADEEVMQLYRLAEEINSKEEWLTQKDRNQFIERINVISSSLTLKEREFSDVLGSAARKINTLLFYANIVLIIAIIASAWKFWSILYAKLKTSNLHLQKTLQFGKMGSAVMDYETKEVTLSDEFKQILDLPRGASSKTTIQDFVSTYVIPEDQNLVLNVTGAGEEAEDKSSPTTLQYRIKTATGGNKLLDAQGFFSNKNVFAIFRDITNLRKIEAETIENEKRLKHILEGLPVAVYLTDSNGTITFFNDAASKLWERYPVLNEEKWCGSHKLYTSDGDPLMHEDCPMAVSVKSRAPVRNIEAKLETPTGKIKDFIANTTPIWDGLNSFAGAMNVMLDISERKQNELEISTRRKFLTTLIGNVPGIVYQSTLHPKISVTYISPQVENITGYKVEDFLSGKIRALQIVDPHDRPMVRRTILHAVTNDSVYDLEYRIHTRDGRIRWVWEKGRGVTDNNGTFLYLEGFIEDITEQKNNAIALKESESRFRNLVRDLGVGIVVFDDKLKIELVNSAITSLLNTSEQALKSKQFNELFKIYKENGTEMSPHEYPAALVRHSRKPHYGTTMGISVDGNVLWVIIDSIPVFKEDGSLHHIISTVTDISGRIKSAEKEKEISTRLVLATTAAHLGIWDWNIESNLSIWSDYMYEIFGISKSDHNNNHSSWLKCIHPDDRPKADADIQFALATGNYNSEYRIIRADGSIRYIVSKGILHRNAEGKPRKLVGVDWDVTKDRLYEHAIRESEGRFRHVSDSAPVLIWMTGLDRKLNYFNKTWLEFTGKNLSDQLENGWVEAIHPDDSEKFFNTFFHAFEKREPFQLTMRLRSASKEYRWLHVNGVPRFDTQSNFLGFIGSCNDVHKSVEMAAQLSENQLQLEELLEEKDLLIREIHHRVKNNLQVMSSVLFLKAQTLKDPSMRMLLTESRQRLRSMAMIHERLMQSGGQITQINIRDYLNGLIHEQKQALSIDPEYISVEVEVEEFMMNLDQVVNIGFIINETMTNAVKHAFPVQKNGSIKVFFGHTEDKLQLKISDNGIGLPSHVSLNNSNFFGIQLIKVFTNHLGGEVTVNTANGTNWTINFN